MGTAPPPPTPPPPPPPPPPHPHPHPHPHPTQPPTPVRPWGQQIVVITINNYMLSIRDVIIFSVQL